MEELFENSPVKRVYFKLALPVVFSMVASMIYNLADTYFVAKTGNTDLVAGVSIGAPLFTFMLAVGDIFGLGGSALISRLFGQKEHNLSRKVSSFSLYISIVLSIVLTVLLLVFEQPILGLLGAKASTYEYAAGFYRGISIGAVFIIVSLVPSNMIRTEGLAAKSMFATVSGTILAIILDPIFLFVFNWGATGVAAANVIGYALNTCMLLYYTHHDAQYLTINPMEFKIDKRSMAQIIEIGIPASITNFMQSFGMALLNNYLASYGADKVAAMGITQKIYSIVILIMVGFAFGAQPLIGYNYGAKNKERLHEIMRFDFFVEVVYAVLFSGILMIIAPLVVKLFMNKPDIISNGAYMLRACLATTPFVGAILVYTTVFQSAAKALDAFIMSISRQGIVYLIAILIMNKLCGFHGVVWAQAVSDIVTCAIGYGLYRNVFKKFGK